MNTFEKQQAAKLLSCYITPEEIQKSLDNLDIEKAHPVGYINKNGFQKQPDGKYKYVGKGKTSKQQDADPHIAIHEDAKKIAEHAGISEKEYRALHPDTKKELYNNMQKEGNSKDSDKSTHDDSSIKLGQEVTLPNDKGVIMDVNRNKRIAEVGLESGKIIKVKFDDIHTSREGDVKPSPKAVEKKEGSAPKGSNKIPSGMQNAIDQSTAKGHWMGKAAEDALKSVDINKLDKMMQDVEKYAIGKVQVEFSTSKDGTNKIEFNDVSSRHYDGKHFDNAPSELEFANKVSKDSGPKTLAQYVTSVSSSGFHFTMNELKNFIEVNK